jgi:parallel beta-helix repeat protein
MLLIPFIEESALVGLKRVSVIGSAVVGIYVDDYVTDTLIEKSRVKDSGGVGIYLEHSSARTQILDSDITGNGFKLHREGIAIDSSRDNVVSNSSILNNFAGGIYIYRNCSEYLLEDKKQAVRWQSADKNLITSNEIQGGLVGIWIASRQSMDTSVMRCGNGYYAEGKYTLDSAKFNIVSKNQISHCDFGIIVEDDDNWVIGNFIKNITLIAIKVGSIPKAKYLDLPVKRVRLNNNKFEGVREKLIFVGNSSADVF